jgi:hypothetical protein
MMEETQLNVSQRGDEICLNCKHIWQEHEGKQNECTAIGFVGKYFLHSGRVEIKTPRITNNHYGPPSLPAFPPYRQPEKHQRFH